MRSAKRAALAVALLIGVLRPDIALQAQAAPAAPAALPRTIDVIATDSRGRPIPRLTAADFIVEQEGQPQPIESVEWIHDGGRVVGIFLDEFHTAPGSAADRARAGLLEFVRTRVTIDDRIAVFKPLDSLLAIKWLERDQVIGAIESFQGRQGDYEPRSDFERNYLSGAPERVEAARTQIALSALNALAIHLGTEPRGRRTLIIAGGGLPRRTRSRGEAPLPTLDSVVRAANRNRVAIYPLDVNEAAGADDDAAREGLRVLADGTAGRIITADQQTAGFSAMLADASNYYVLTLQPAAPAPDDRFHPVVTKTPRKDVSLRARAGYWAAVPAPVRTTRNGRDSSSPFRVPNKISPLVRSWFGMAPGNDGATRVSFVWEPAPRVPGDRSRAPLPARVALNVAREDTGETVFDGAVLPSIGAPDDPDAAAMRATFELPPGKLRVSMSIQDAASQQLDTDVREVTVGGFPGTLTLGTLQVLRARNAREFRAVAASREGVPVVSRQFSRSERLLIRIPTDAGSGVPAVSAGLVSRFGARRDLEVAGWPDSKGYQVDVPLAGLAAGEYVVEVTATNADGTARDSVAFRVTP
jgi:VWFA-related protein